MSDNDKRWYYTTPTNKYDDWGTVRDADGYIVACARAGAEEYKESEHRRNRTDPYKKNAVKIAAAPVMLAALKAAYPVIVENASDWDMPGDLPREMLAAIQAAEPGWTPPVQFAFEAVPLHKLNAGELFRVSMHNPDTVTNRGKMYRAGSTKLGELLWCYPSGDRSPVIMSDTIKVHREVRPANPPCYVITPPVFLSGPAKPRYRVNVLDTANNNSLEGIFSGDKPSVAIAEAEKFVAELEAKDNET